MRFTKFNLAEDLLAELVVLAQSLAQFPDIEAAMRLRALTELSEHLDTDALCQLLSDTVRLPTAPPTPRGTVSAKVAPRLA